MINKIMGFDLLVFFTLILVMGAINAVFIWDNRHNAWYLDIAGSNYDYTSRGIFDVFTWWLLSNQLIPLTLVIILEFAKIFYTWIIQNDVQMYDDTIMEMCKPMDFGIHEDLGSIDYIFTDKTGTLTANILNFEAFSVNGKPYFVKSDNKQLKEII